MLVVKEIDRIVHDGNSIVTLGTFDGIHLGHREIIRRLTLEAGKRHLRSVVVTFDPHPQLFLRPEKTNELKILTTVDEKVDIFQSLGIDLLLIATFDRSLASMAAEEFVTDILMGKIGMKKFLIGHDHSFGKNRGGNYQTLIPMSGKLGFEMERVDVFSKNGVVVNSSLIRKLVMEGDVANVRIYLERPYVLSGEVVKGDGRGRQIGIPTTNLKIDHPQKMLPKRGVYSCRVHLAGNIFNAVTNIGIRPTFHINPDSIVVESHILNFDQEIYGKRIRLEFINRLRDEMKFDSVDALKSAIKNDIQAAINQGFTYS